MKTTFPDDLLLILLLLLRRLYFIPLILVPIIGEWFARIIIVSGDTGNCWKECRHGKEIEQKGLKIREMQAKKEKG